MATVCFRLARNMHSIKELRHWELRDIYDVSNDIEQYPDVKEVVTALLNELARVKGRIKDLSKTTL